MVNNGGNTSIEDPPAGSNLPANGAQWVELLVGEVLTATSVEDAKVRLTRGLEALERSICDNATAEASKRFQKVCSVWYILNNLACRHPLWSNI